MKEYFPYRSTKDTCLLILSQIRTICLWNLKMLKS
ncbi:hypothetical protein Lser_V15G12881 [Lactuca serriola]